MESTRQEMDLLSNSIAAFAHIKGEATCVSAPKQLTAA